MPATGPTRACTGWSVPDGATSEPEADKIIGAFLGAGGATPTAVALAWAAAQPAITSVIIGPRTQEQLEQNLAGIGLCLPDDDIAHLTQISQPADGGRA